MDVSNREKLLNSHALSSNPARTTAVAKNLAT
jgi:hypothetical protein